MTALPSHSSTQHSTAQHSTAQHSTRNQSTSLAQPLLLSHDINPRCRLAAHLSDPRLAQGGTWRALSPIGCQALMQPPPRTPTSSNVPTPSAPTLITSNAATTTSNTADSNHNDDVPSSNGTACNPSSSTPASPYSPAHPPTYLGESWAAPLGPTPHLRGVRALQPTWRHVAAVLAPLLDPSAVSVQVSSLPP